MAFYNFVMMAFWSHIFRICDKLLIKSFLHFSLFQFFLYRQFSSTHKSSCSLPNVWCHLEFKRKWKILYNYSPSKFPCSKSICQPQKDMFTKLNPIFSYSENGIHKSVVLIKFVVQAFLYGTIQRPKIFLHTWGL